MKKINLISIIVSSLLLTDCNNSPMQSNTSEIKSTTIEQRRTDYLQKKGWLSPENMELFAKCVVPYEERHPMDEEQRKSHILDCFRTSKVSEPKIDSISNEIEQITGGRTGHWNYEYIVARFENYKREMLKDSLWNKIESEYQSKLKR